MPKKVKEVVFKPQPLEGSHSLIRDCLMRGALSRARLREAVRLDIDEERFKSLIFRGARMERGD